MPTSSSNTTTTGSAGRQPFKKFVEKKSALQSLMRGAAMVLYDEDGSYNVRVTYHRDKHALILLDADTNVDSAVAAHQPSPTESSGSNVLNRDSGDTLTVDEDDTTMAIAIADIAMVGWGNPASSSGAVGGAKSEQESSVLWLELIEGDVMQLDCLSRVLAQQWRNGLRELLAKGAPSSTAKGLALSPIRGTVGGDTSGAMAAPYSNQRQAMPHPSPAAAAVLTTSGYDPYRALRQDDDVLGVYDQDEGWTPAADEVLPEYGLGRYEDERLRAALARHDRRRDSSGGDERVLAAPVWPRDVEIERRRREAPRVVVEPRPTPAAATRSVSGIRPLFPESEESAPMELTEGSTGELSPAGRAVLVRELEEMRRMLEAKNDTIKQLREAVTILEEQRSIEATGQSERLQLRSNFGSDSHASHSAHFSVAASPQPSSAATANGHETPQWIEDLVHRYRVSGSRSPPQEDTQRTNTAPSSRRRPSPGVPTTQLHADPMGAMMSNSDRIPRDQRRVSDEGAHSVQFVDDNEDTSASAVQRRRSAGNSSEGSAAQDSVTRPSTTPYAPPARGHSDPALDGLDIPELVEVHEGMLSRAYNRPATAGGRLPHPSQMLADEALEALPAHPATPSDTTADEMSAPNSRPLTSDAPGAATTEEESANSEAIVAPSRAQREEDLPRSHDGPAADTLDRPRNRHQAARPRLVSGRGDMGAETDLEAALRGVGVTPDEREHMLRVYHEIHGDDSGGDSDDSDEQ